jgi:hypothetical protein
MHTMMTPILMIRWPHLSAKEVDVNRLYSLSMVVVAVLVVTLLLLLLATPGEITAGGAQSGAAITAAAVGTGFTYQGHLRDGANPANGAYDFQFKLFDAASVGVQVGSTVALDNLPVTNGLFGLELDFGAGAIGGGARWLEIGVRPGVSVGAYTLLSPRQKLTPAPYALALPNVYTDEGINFVGVGRNFRISGNEVFGVRYVGSADQYGGMYVETAHANGWPFYGYATNGSFRAWTYYNGTTGDWHLYNAGIRLTVQNEGRVTIGPSADYSLVITNTTGSDGIRLYDTGDDAIQVGSSPDYSNYGLYIPSPGVMAYGLWPNTANAAGEWALYTVDNIEAGNVLANAYSLVAKVTGSDPLTAGDVVAIAGMADSVPGGHDSLPAVRPAGGKQFTGIIGVVKSRMVWENAPGKEEGSLHSADGPAQPGDYVSLVVLGVTQVKVEAGAAIKAGDRLTASELSGRVRALQTRTLEGMVVTEGAQVVGIALAAPLEGQDTIPVFVTLR